MRKPAVSLERIAGWALPLMTIFLLLGALEEAVRAGQLRWAPAGVTAYVVSLGMWLAMNLLRSKPEKAAPASAPSRPPSQAETEIPQPSSESKFAEFGEWFFPALALAALVSASFMAALRGELSWALSGGITCAGCFLVWAGWLSRPRVSWPEAPPVSGGWGKPVSETLRPMDYLVSAGLLMMSIGVVAGAIASTHDGLRAGWVFTSLACFVAYVAGAIVRDIRTTPQRRGILLTVAAAVALGALAAALATAVWLHRVSWVVATVIGVCGCLALWVSWVFRSLPPPPPPPPGYEYHPPSYNRVPSLLLAGLLAFAGFAVYRHEIPALWGAALAVLGGLTLWFSWMFVVSVQTDGPPQVESNWTGLGGGLGGWRCSASLVYALCALTLAVFAGSAIYQALNDARSRNAANQTKSTGGSASAANPARSEPLNAAPSSTSNKPEQR
jgi:hypothetical protein